MDSHLFWIVIVKLYIGFTRVWDWERILVFSLSDEHPDSPDFKLSCSLWERIYIARNQWYCRHVLSSMSFCWWSEQRQRKRVICSTLPTTPAIFFQTDMDHMCLHMHGAWWTPDTTELMQTELQCMCCKTNVQNEYDFQCLHKSVAQWIPYAINLSGCACTYSTSNH